jgi:ribosome-associated protein
MPDDENQTAELPGEVPSKSALKRRMLALQKLGETLVGLSEKQLCRIPIDNERLLDVIREARGMHSHSARRRHMQLIGKLMRDTDAAPIESALSAMDRQRQEDAGAFHDLEKLRDEVLAAGQAGVELVLQRCPEADRQQLRQLLLQHRRESERGKPPAASRKLFRYLRELQELHGLSGPG